MLIEVFFNKAHRREDESEKVNLEIDFSKNNQSARERGEKQKRES